MKRLTFIITLIATLATMCGCKSKEKAVSTASYHNYETECMGKSMDGKQTLRVWAQGKNRSDAIKQARKKAVYDVTFTGISAGSGECSSYPVVDEPNARRKYEKYFDKFFADGGTYRKFAEAADGKNEVDAFQGKNSQTYGIVVTVDRAALRKRLEKDEIIK